MDRQAVERRASIEQNDELKNTCRTLAEQYEEREKKLLASQSQRDLEMSLLNAQLQEKEEGYKKDIEKATKAARENAMLEAGVKDMEKQVSTYKGKLSTFEGSLDRSKKVFTQYTRERAKVERHVQSLEQEKKNHIDRHEKKNAGEGEGEGSGIGAESGRGEALQGAAEGAAGAHAGDRAAREGGEFFFEWW